MAKKKNFEENNSMSFQQNCKWSIQREKTITGHLCMI